MNDIIKKLVYENKNELVNILKRLVDCPSVSSDAKDGYPYGPHVAKVLDTALAICNDYGFETENVDYRAGYAQIGKGESLIGILGHLDVVPAGEGWKTDPFEMTEKNGILYGRGVMDDKGPVVANIIALKIVKQLKPEINARVRLIMGCDEERGSSGLAHYVAKKGHIDMGYTPDGDFPLVFGEKGILHFDCFFPTNLKYVHGGEVYNAAISKVEVTINTLDFDVDKAKAFLNEHNLSLVQEGNMFKLVGIAAHGSTPEKGVNAASYLFEALYVAGCKDNAVVAYHNYFGLGYNGEKLNINHEDKYGNLTLNVGKVRLIDGNLVVSCDVRYPITTNPEEMETKIKSLPFDVKVQSHAKALYMDPESDLVQILLKSYRDVTNDLTDPITIGGGTYARGINNCVAFGAMKLHKEYNIHNINEEIPVSELLEQCEIYVHAILNMIAYYEGK